MKNTPNNPEGKVALPRLVLRWARLVYATYTLLISVWLLFAPNFWLAVTPMLVMWGATGAAVSRWKHYTDALRLAFLQEEQSQRMREFLKQNAKTEP